MSDVAVLGLGAMGAAIALAQLNGGFNLAVWNRTPAKAEPLIARGARRASDPGDAIASAPVTIICVDNYAVTEEMLAGHEHILKDRTLVQVSTGSPKEARTLAAKVHDQGGLYLDGAIMCYPDEIGALGSLIMTGGDDDARAASARHVDLLGGDVRHFGENPAAPAALDMGLLATSVALYAGVAHAARLCEAEGVRVGDLARVATHGDRPRGRFEIIDQDAFALNSLHGGAALSVWAGVARRLVAQAQDAGIDASIPEFLTALYEKGVALGHGEEDVAALIKVLRNGA